MRGPALLIALALSLSGCGTILSHLGLQPTATVAPQAPPPEPVALPRVNCPNAPSAPQQPPRLRTIEEIGKWAAETETARQETARDLDLCRASVWRLQEAFRALTPR